MVNKILSAIFLFQLFLNMVWWAYSIYRSLEDTSDSKKHKNFISASLLLAFQLLFLLFVSLIVSAKKVVLG